MAIDLKSFYASVECVDRGLDPLTTDLVVADPSRTAKTICLAVSPSLKAQGVRNRCRVFEIPESLRYIMAPPRMQRYIDVSAEIYGVYLSWFAKEDIHVYSIDEAFFDLTPYLGLYGCSARELAERVRQDVVDRTGIPATCGMGPNLYLAKVALDITAKHAADFFGELSEESYRATLWNHRPLTDFWRVGAGTARSLATMGIHTMGELALAPEEPLYRAFGVDAEILIDHAWGVEPVQMHHIKAYRSKTHCVTNAQVLGCDASFAQARTIVKEMVDSVALQLVEDGKAATSIVLSVGYALTPDERAARRGIDGPYWRGMPGARGSWRLEVPTNSRHALLAAALAIYDREVAPARRVHRLNVTADGVVDADAAGTQLSLFTDEAHDARELAQQRAVAAVHEKFGKNSLLKGIDLLPEATRRERNEQIGGHRRG